MASPSSSKSVIKYGAHIFLWITRWSDAQLPLLEHARALGLDWLEIAVGDDVTFTPRLARERAVACGLELVVSPGGSWPAECDISLPDPDARQRGLAWHRQNIALAAEAGAVAYTGAIYGHPGTVERRLPTREEYLRIAEGLHQLAETAAQAGVRLVLEPMSHFRTNLVTTPRQALELAALADHANIGLLLDTYHMITEIRDFPAAIATAGPCLWGLHACESDRGVPGGGFVPWQQIATALHAIEFAGYMGLETYNSGPDGLAIARGLLNNPCPDGDRFVAEGLAFLRGLLVKHDAGKL